MNEELQWESFTVGTMSAVKGRNAVASRWVFDKGTPRMVEGKLIEIRYERSVDLFFAIRDGWNAPVVPSILGPLTAFQSLPESNKWHTLFGETRDDLLGKAIASCQAERDNLQKRVNEVDNTLFNLDVLRMEVEA